MNDAPSRDAGRLRRQLVALAIDQAMASQWPQAIETNLYLINASGRDVEACNRLGKAYAQLGRIFAAREAYTATLQIDPTNAIARRNVTRLAALTDGAAAPGGGGTPHADPSFFIEEPGKTVGRPIVSDARGDATPAAVVPSAMLRLHRDDAPRGDDDDDVGAATLGGET